MLKAKYPNLQKIEKNFLRIARNEFSAAQRRTGVKTTDIQALVFRQIWPNTAGGMDHTGFISGQMFLAEYTTVMFDQELGIYAVAFSDKIAYLVINPDKKFRCDVKNQIVRNLGDAKVYAGFKPVER